MEKLNPITAGLKCVEAQCGAVPYYNKDIDKASTNKPITLVPFKGTVHNVSTLEDPVIKRLATENKADIFATERAAAAIMTAPKSLYSWDVIFRKF